MTTQHLRGISVRNILFGVVVGLTLLATFAVLLANGWTVLL